MFTGIIEALGTVENIHRKETNVEFELSCAFADELRIDQSLAHDGVCLTVTKVNEGRYNVTAIAETLNKTNLGSWKKGQKVNLERCMHANGRFDGHIVQGHVDCTARCKSIQDMSGSKAFYFEFPPRFSALIVEKGSITVNGVSLTVVEATAYSFSVHIIPYTLEHTNFHYLKPGGTVNLEFDIVGKYVQRIMGKAG